MTNLKTTNQPLDKLQADIDSFTNISDDLKLCNDTGKQLETLLGKYVNALTSNIKDRLGSSPDVIEAFAIFDLLLLPVTMTASGNTVRAKLQFLPTISFQGMKTRRGSCFASGHRSSFFYLENPFKHHLEPKAPPSSCHFCYRTKVFFTPQCSKRSCSWLKLGFHYHAAMPGLKEEEA